MSLDMSGAVTVADVEPIDDDGEALLDAGRRLATALTWIDEDTAHANRAWAKLPEVLAGPRLTPALEPLMTPVAEKAAKLRAAGEDFFRVTQRLADEIADLKRTREQLVADIEAFHASAPAKALAHAAEQARSGNIFGAVATALTSWNQVPDLVGNELALRIRAEQYEWQRRDTIDTGARQIDAIDIPTVTLPKIGDPSDAAALLTDGMAPAAVAALAGTSVARLLKELSKSQLEKVFSDNAGVRKWLKSQSVTGVSGWWKALSADQKDGIIRGAPGIIGARAGIPYTDRSRANVKLLHRTMALLEKHGDTGGNEYKALRAVERSLNKGKNSGIVYQLVSLTLGTAPLAAISVGNLDTARNVTYMVPGMQTTVQNNMTGYVDAALNLHSQQASEMGGDPSSADVAWIGYQSPENGLVETFESDAVGGGKLLASDLNALDATRAAAGAPAANTSIVAHSYGTIVAASALTAAHADHAVFEGSPGIPLNIAFSASNLDVPKGEVFATQSSHDGLAPVGQILAPIPRVDPTDPAFGAHDFSSDGTNGLRAVTNHGPIDGTSSTRASYWDAGTEAISNAAKATLGKGASIPVGGTPYDRSALNALH